MSLRLWLALLPACLLAQPEGYWVNENPQPAGITRIIVRRELGELFVRAWASCHPVDCDWGDAALLAGGIAWEGYGDRRVQIVPQPDDRLRCVRDNTVEYFVRARAEKPEPLLERVAAFYRGLTMARFEIEIEEVSSAARGRRQGWIFLGARGQIRVESAAPLGPRVLVADGGKSWQDPGPPLTPALASYPFIDRLLAGARITGRERVENRDCTVIRDDAGGRTRTLWIDPTTPLILKDRAEERTPGQAPVTQQITYTLAAIGERMSPDLFDVELAKPAAARVSARPNPGAALVGEPAPEFSLERLDEAPVRLAELRGHVVLAVFWGLEAHRLAALERLHRQFQGSGLVVLGISSGDAAAVRAAAARSGCTFPLLPDPQQEVEGRYHVQSYPTAVVIHREGRVTYYEARPSEDDVRQALARQGIQ